MNRQERGVWFGDEVVNDDDDNDDDDDDDDDDDASLPDAAESHMGPREGGKTRQKGRDG